MSQLELAPKSNTLQALQTLLENAENKYFDLYHSAPIAYFTINSQGLIVNVNASGTELLGIESSQLINRSFARYITLESQAEYQRFLQEATIDHAPHQFQISLLKRNGACVTAEFRGKATRDVNNEMFYMLMIYQTLPSDFIASTNPTYKKTNTQNEMIGLITSELNNPLGIISNYIHGSIKRLESGYTDQSLILAKLKLASDHLERLNEILLRFKNYTLKGKLDYISINPHSLISDTINILQEEMGGPTVTINYRANRTIPSINADKLYIQHVLLNIMRNAVEAMVDGAVKDPVLTIEVNQPNKDFIEILIMDNGPGFSVANSHVLFNPSYTTKPYGLGLGLPLSRTIIHLHHGEIEPNFEQSTGASISIRIPIEPAR